MNPVLYGGSLDLPTLRLLQFAQDQLKTQLFDVLVELLQSVAEMAADPSISTNTAVRTVCIAAMKTMATMVYVVLW